MGFKTPPTRYYRIAAIACLLAPSLLLFGSDNSPSKEKILQDSLFEDASREELLITELDDMKNLFPFKEKLDPKDPALFVETIAKHQQEEFIRSKESPEKLPLR